VTTYYIHLLLLCYY